jgi:hypothetical protein
VWEWDWDWEALDLFVPGLWDLRVLDVKDSSPGRCWVGLCYQSLELLNCSARLRIQHRVFPDRCLRKRGD